MRIGPIVSALLWSGLAILFGCAIGHSAHRHPEFCGQFASFCNLRPAGFGFWSIGISSVLLLFGLIDLLRVTAHTMRVSVATAEERTRLICAALQTAIGGLSLLLLLFAAFVPAR